MVEGTTGRTPMTTCCDRCTLCLMSHARGLYHTCAYAQCLRSAFLTRPRTPPCANQGFAYAKCSYDRAPINTIQKVFGSLKWRLGMAYETHSSNTPCHKKESSIQEILNIQSKDGQDLLKDKSQVLCVRLSNRPQNQAPRCANVCQTSLSDPLDLLCQMS